MKHFPIHYEFCHAYHFHLPAVFIPSCEKNKTQLKGTKNHKNSIGYETVSITL